MYFLTSVIWKMTPFKSIMQCLEQMVPQQTMTAQAMQMSAQMARVATQVPKTQWFQYSLQLGFWIALKNLGPRQSIGAISIWDSFFPSACGSYSSANAKEKETSRSNKEETQAKLNPPLSSHFFPSRGLFSYGFEEICATKSHQC